ncbi:MAG: 3-isopropylmalate dehydratase large subunit [Spartobacteria bacterium]|nr:3-isopropylmalate dehydratase large subunit [Spartobacteria bacterium]
MGKTLAQKIFDSHRVDEPFPGEEVLRIDVVMCHEITTPIAILDLVKKGKDRIFDTTKIKAVVDHVTPSKDSKTAAQAKILRDWARRHDVKDFFDVGRNGVCHAIFPEKGFIRPGYTVIMGDSHTCTHGAFGAFAAGVGTTDLEVGILKGVCAFRAPRTIRINIDGTLPKGVYAKDVILHVIQQMTVNGATDCVVEFVGPVVTAMSMESRMTMCNMAVEMGATSGICMPDETTLDYLWPFVAESYKNDRAAALSDFETWHSDADADFYKQINVDVSDMEPLMTVGYKPDQVKTIAEMAGSKVDQVYLGSCTNGRIEDLAVAAKILEGKTVHPMVRLIVSPATPKIYQEADALGYVKIFMDAGACLTNPTCGACLGMSNGVLADGEVCASTTNRNFAGRMGKGGMVHLMSPASAAATAIEGCIADPRNYL